MSKDHQHRHHIAGTALRKSGPDGSQEGERPKPLEVLSKQDLRLRRAVVSGIRIRRNYLIRIGAIPVLREEQIPDWVNRQFDAYDPRNPDRENRRELHHLLAISGVAKSNLWRDWSVSRKAEAEVSEEAPRLHDETESSRLMLRHGQLLPFQDAVAACVGGSEHLFVNVGSGDNESTCQLQGERADRGQSQTHVYLGCGESLRWSPRKLLEQFVLPERRHDPSVQRILDILTESLQEELQQFQPEDFSQHSWEKDDSFFDANRIFVALADAPHIITKVLESRKSAAEFRESGEFAGDTRHVAAQVRRHHIDASNLTELKALRWLLRLSGASSGDLDTLFAFEERQFLHTELGQLRARCLATRKRERQDLDARGKAMLEATDLYETFRFEDFVAEVALGAEEVLHRPSPVPCDVESVLKVTDEIQGRSDDDIDITHPIRIRFSRAGSILRRYASDPCRARQEARTFCKGKELVWTPAEFTDEVALEVSVLLRKEIPDDPPTTLELISEALELLKVGGPLQLDFEGDPEALAARLRRMHSTLSTLASPPYNRAEDIGRIAQRYAAITGLSVPEDQTPEALVERIDDIMRRRESPAMPEASATTRQLKRLLGRARGLWHRRKKTPDAASGAMPDTLDQCEVEPMCDEYIRLVSPSGDVPHDLSGLIAVLESAISSAARQEAVLPRNPRTLFSQLLTLSGKVSIIRGPEISDDILVKVSTALRGVREVSAGFNPDLPESDRSGVLQRIAQAIAAIEPLVTPNLAGSEKRTGELDPTQIAESLSEIFHPRFVQGVLRAELYKREDYRNSPEFRGRKTETVHLDANQKKRKLKDVPASACVMVNGTAIPPNPSVTLSVDGYNVWRNDKNLQIEDDLGRTHTLTVEIEEMPDLNGEIPISPEHFAPAFFDNELEDVLPERTVTSAHAIKSLSHLADLEGKTQETAPQTSFENALAIILRSLRPGGAFLFDGNVESYTRYVRCLGNGGLPNGVSEEEFAVEISWHEGRPHSFLYQRRGGVRMLTGGEKQAFFKEGAVCISPEAVLAMPVLQITQEVRGQIRSLGMSRREGFEGNMNRGIETAALQFARRQALTHRWIPCLMAGKQEAVEDIVEAVLFYLRAQFQNLFRKILQEGNAADISCQLIRNMHAFRDAPTFERVRDELARHLKIDQTYPNAVEILAAAFSFALRRWVAWIDDLVDQKGHSRLTSGVPMSSVIHTRVREMTAAAIQNPEDLGLRNSFSESVITEGVHTVLTALRGEVARRLHEAQGTSLGLYGTQQGSYLVNTGKDSVCIFPRRQAETNIGNRFQILQQLPDNEKLKVTVESEVALNREVTRRLGGRRILLVNWSDCVTNDFLLELLQKITAGKSDIIRCFPMRFNSRGQVILGPRGKDEEEEVVSPEAALGRFGQELRRMKVHGGIVVVGGSWESVYDPKIERFIVNMGDEIVEALALSERVGACGICFGHQMSGNAWERFRVGMKRDPSRGHAVCTQPGSLVIGPIPNTITPAGQQSHLFRGLGDKFTATHTHGDHCVMQPKGAAYYRVLAKNGLTDDPSVWEVDVHRLFRDQVSPGGQMVCAQPHFEFDWGPESNHLERLMREIEPYGPFLERTFDASLEQIQVNLQHAREQNIAPTRLLVPRMLLEILHRIDRN